MAYLGRASRHGRAAGRVEYATPTMGCDAATLGRWVRLQIAASKLERALGQWRSAPDGTPLLMRGDRRVIVSGYAVVFNTLTNDLGGFREMIRRGAFRRSLASDRDIRLLDSHTSTRCLASTRQGTLTLREDEHGLFIDATLADVVGARRVVDRIQHGVCRGLSIGFKSPRDSIHQGHGHKLLSVRDLELDHIAVTARPAYRHSTVTVELRAR